MSLAMSDRLSSPIKVGIVGVGQRIQEVYLPILKQLSQRYEVVGFTTRSSESRKNFREQTGFQAFENASDLVQIGKPDFLIVAVASQANEEILMNLLDLKVPLLTETPLAWSIASGRRILQKAAANRVLLGVAEQMPFLPIEQFKKSLIELGVFGKIYAAYNDFNSYSYHGIAQLRRYLNGSPTEARSLLYSFGTDPNPQYANQWTGINWQFGSVSFDDQSALFHHYSDHYAVSDLCFPQAIRLYGKAAVMVGDEIKLLNQNLQQTDVVRIHREVNENQALLSISATFPTVGTVTWKNPYTDCAFSDLEIAVTTLLDGMANAVLRGGQPLYTGEEFLKDIEIVQALRYSELRGGAKVPLPLHESWQKLLLAIHPSYWKAKLSR